jgi:hypothetical protein
MRLPLINDISTCTGVGSTNGSTNYKNKDKISIIDTNNNEEKIKSLLHCSLK